MIEQKRKIIPHPTMTDEFFIRSLLLYQTNKEESRINQDRTNLINYDVKKGINTPLNYRFMVGWSLDGFNENFLEAVENRQEIPTNFCAIDRYLNSEQTHPLVLKAVFNMLVTNDLSAPRVAADLIHRVVNRLQHVTEVFGQENVADYYNDRFVELIGNEHAKIFQSQFMLDGKFVSNTEKYLISIMDTDYSNRLVNDLILGVNLTTSHAERNFINNRISSFFKKNKNSINNLIFMPEDREEANRQGFFDLIPKHIHSEVMEAIDQKPVIHAKFVKAMTQTFDLDHVGIEKLLRSAASNHSLDGKTIRNTIDYSLMKNGVAYTQGQLIQYAINTLAQNPLNANDSLNVGVNNFLKAVHAFKRSSPDTQPVMPAIVTHLENRLKLMLDGTRVKNRIPPHGQQDPYENLLTHLSMATQEGNKCAYKLEPETGWGIALEALINTYNQSALSTKGSSIILPNDDFIQMQSSLTMARQDQIESKDRHFSADDISEQTL